jgi:hypothetical protein
MVFPALRFTGTAISLRVLGKIGLREQSPASEQHDGTTICSGVDVGCTDCECCSLASYTRLAS